MNSLILSFIIVFIFNVIWFFSSKTLKNYIDMFNFKSKIFPKWVVFSVWLYNLFGVISLVFWLIYVL